MIKNEILETFSKISPEGCETVTRTQLLGIMRSLLPDATTEELDALLEDAEPSEDINFKSFIDSLLDDDGSSSDTSTVPSQSSSRSTAASQQRSDPDASPSDCKTQKQGCKAETLEIPQASARRQSVHLVKSPVGYASSKSLYRPSSHPGLMSGSGDACPFCSANGDTSSNPALLIAEAARQLLPKRVILVRHGESEGNVDPNVYKEKPDNKIELTDKGSEQAREAGKRIKQIIGDELVQLIVSPFIRTVQTARNILESIKAQTVQDVKDPLIREQEFGNLQGDDFANCRAEQKTVGRYFYRFPTGESGADVHARVKTFWDNSLLQVNLRPGYANVENVVLVTHGLTMRYILMQLYNWSPNTVETVWNAHNCEIYVLKRDLSIPGHSPFIICTEEGNMPRSTVSLNVTFKSGITELYRLDDYLSVPMPRTKQTPIVKIMLQKQFGLDPDTIESIDFYGGKFKKRL